MISVFNWVVNWWSWNWNIVNWLWRTRSWAPCIITWGSYTSFAVGQPANDNPTVSHIDYCNSVLTRLPIIDTITSLVELLSSCLDCWQFCIISAYNFTNYKQIWCCVSNCHKKNAVWQTRIIGLWIDMSRTLCWTNITLSCCL